MSEKRITCPLCSGSGQRQDAGIIFKACRLCKGWGKVTAPKAR